MSRDGKKKFKKSKKITCLSGKKHKGQTSSAVQHFGRWGNEQERSYLNRKPKAVLALAKTSAKRKTQL